MNIFNSYLLLNHISDYVRTYVPILHSIPPYLHIFYQESSTRMRINKNSTLSSHGSLLHRLHDRFIHFPLLLFIHFEACFGHHASQPLPRALFQPNANAELNVSASLRPYGVVNCSVQSTHCNIHRKIVGSLG